MRRLSRAIPAALALALILLPSGPVAGQEAAEQQASQPAPRQDASFSMALTGDAIITRRLSVYREPAFLELMELIRGADMAFVNLEVLFHDYEPWPAHQSGGTYMRADPALARELVWAGFDIVSMANNHTGDYGVEGMRLTQKYVEEAGLVHAGTGENLYEAREAKFLETHGGRVALISVASTFPAHSVASKPKGAVRGRPGLSPLRYSREGDATVPDAEDMEEISAVVRNAAALADYVIVTNHSHESGADRAYPADFLITFSRAMIDAGADLVVGHGPHVLRGIEIYKGKPIFYSLGDFIFQNETLLRLPWENYRPYDLGENHHVADFNAARYANETRGFPTQREIWESVVAMPRWQGKELVALELHPITLGFGLPASQRGRPLLADPELGRKIIHDLVERSQPFGTVVEWREREGIGVVRLR
jgi:poly-gamma-glutamate capsule biosynthesis protein CapA/YwtB (metallophosphatase superfamily)